MDRDRVINALESAIELSAITGSVTVKTTQEVARRAVEMLKDQEAVKPVRDEQTGRLWLCGKCDSYVGFEDNDTHDPNEFDKYCRDCGTPVLWEGR